MTFNIDDLTIKQVREITALVSNTNSSVSEKSTLSNDAVGKYAIIRTRNEGINFGKVLHADSTGVVITEAQRIYYHKPADSKSAWYEGVAMTGLHSDSKVSIAVDKKIIVEDYSITLCSDKAVKSIKEHTPNGS